MHKKYSFTAVRRPIRTRKARRYEYYQGGGYLLGCRGSIVFDGTGIQKIRRRISFVPSDYRSIDLHALRQACVFTKHLHRQRMKFDGFSEFSTGGHSRSLQFWYESTGNFTRNPFMIL